MAYTLAEKTGATRPAPETMNVKTYGMGLFTDDFCLADKGWEHAFALPFLAVYKKNGRTLIQVRGREWKRQRAEDFKRLHGQGV
ncbi:hypothetical protein [Desulfatibacillum aliphaticivorans]|uniref:hypothetical protein n=1 Tax=Desulfatibacillum aliphaticivorans TaxID=218208 RepID=UPI0003FDAAFE|nr:hypothetical protein [Desulfatibacillum aliphaticivorans]